MSERQGTIRRATAADREADQQTLATARLRIGILVVARAEPVRRRGGGIGFVDG